MKQIVFIIIASLLMLPLQAQEVDTIPVVTPAPEVEEVPALEEVPAMEEAPALEEVPAMEEAPEDLSSGDTVNVLGKLEVIETPEATIVTIGENEVIIVEENGDTVIVVLGRRGVNIVEGENGTEITMMEREDLLPRYESKTKKKKFRPHYAGIELGLNNFVTPDFSMTLPQEDAFMDLNTGRSWNWNINIIDYGFGFGTDKAGIVTGLGFEIINYRFDGQNSIRKDSVTREIVEYVPDNAENITKSKLNITYMTVPLLLEFQIPTQHKRVYISAGVVGGLKLWSNTKMKYTVNGEKTKEKGKGDYNLNPLRWGVTARVGYRGLGLYANYYFTPLFKDDMGPELYPFAVGLAVAF